MFSSPTLIKHYTPPTCTLEIYRNSSFLSLQNNNKIPNKFNFQLHFDDPRLPDEKTITVTGDRHKLDLLSQIVHEHISKLMNEDRKQNLNKLEKNNNQAINNNIYLLDKGLLNQELYLFSKDNNNLEIMIKLTTLQLFDLANALDQYTLDINNPKKDYFNVDKKSTFVFYTAMLLICAGVGGVLWREKQIVSKNDQQIVTLENKNFPSVLSDIIPPQPLKPETIPHVSNLKLAPDLQNRQTLPPPPSMIAKPPQQPNIGNISLPNANIQNSQNAQNIIIPPPPQNPLPPPIAPQFMPNSPNLISINPNPQPLPPKLSGSNSGIIGSERVSSLPVLQSSSAITPPSNIDNSLSNAVSVIPENIKKIPSSFQSSASQSQMAFQSQKMNYPKPKAIQTEVKQYFQQKWQPPENLSQSIEYRLVVNNDGSLQRVTPIGQGSVTFLDRSGIPLMGEAIASSFTENKQAIVRLILSPNGNVETFLE